MIPAHVRIFVCTEPMDLRRSFDGLALAARERLGEDPRAGGLFVFTNRRANR
ncbi:IS66 family insertion sequence element accessory protein TnpB, partial [Nocardioides abyssi]|uniref:IS66 family insertion sequence element accessory protein TnpB n=1 Tax=Nocardioides abyssi TaxID=3058370 RepID=UPI0034DE8549